MCNKIVKNLSRKAIIQVTHIINAIIKLKHFPKTFKHAIIHPIPKPNKNPTNPSYYRPKSLLNTLAKLADKVLITILKNELKNNKIENENQFGFKNNHNTTMQRCRIINDIQVNYNKENVTNMVLLDFEKAFDHLWIDGLIKKLIKYQQINQIQNIPFPNNPHRLIHERTHLPSKSQ